MLVWAQARFLGLGVLTFEAEQFFVVGTVLCCGVLGPRPASAHWTPAVPSPPRLGQTERRDVLQTRPGWEQRGQRVWRRVRVTPRGSAHGRHRAAFRVPAAHQVSVGSGTNAPSLLVCPRLVLSRFEFEGVATGESSLEAGEDEEEVWLFWRAGHKEVRSKSVRELAQDAKEGQKEDRDVLGYYR